MALLNTKSSYTRFTDSRDRVLETLLLKARERVGDQMRRFMVSIKDEVVRTYPLLNKENIDPQTINHVRIMDQQMHIASLKIAFDISNIWKRLKIQSYALAYAGEFQAINNVGIKSHRKKLHQHDISKHAAKDSWFGTVDNRTQLSLDRIRRDAIDQVEVARILQEDLPTALERVLNVFPKPEIVKQPRVLPRNASYKETKIKKDDEEIDIDTPVELMDKSEWEDIVDAYEEEYIPSWRDPRTGVLETPVTVGQADEYITYAWQLESELTEDFVKSVRDGENEAANAKGITDVVWIAVIDKKTDDCCLKRNGLTSTEIEDKLNDEWSGEECRAIVPPAHFNCRCRPMPSADNLPDVPDGDGIDYESWMYPK